MVQQFHEDVENVSRIPAVPTILEVVRRTAGLRFVTIARVTEHRWIACSVLDDLGFGLQAGSELDIATTICNEIRQSREPVVIENVAVDAVWCNHPVPAMYVFQSYISVPIILADNSFFGTLCGLDTEPAHLKRPEIIGMFRLFAELIAKHLDAHSRLASVESALAEESMLATERKNALRISEARYRDVVETQTEMVCRCLPDTTLTFVNEAYCRYFGKSREQLIGRRFLELLPPSEQPRVLELIQATLEGRHSGPNDQQNVISNGEIRWVQWVNHALRDESGGIEIQAIGRDITEQKQTQMQLEASQEHLRSSQAQIRKLAGSLMKAQEKERRHIARELHDDLSQRIAWIGISLSNINRRLPASDGLRDQVEEVQKRVKEVSRDIRGLSHKLHPVALEHAGLSVALQSMIAESNHLQQVRFELRVPDHVPPVSHEISICIFRIAQEAVRNILNHSQANQADIDLSSDNGSIRLLITDDGCGFNLESAQKRGGMGLISMAERVRQFQGAFEVRTKLGEGTSLRVVLPVGTISSEHPPGDEPVSPSLKTVRHTKRERVDPAVAGE